MFNEIDNKIINLIKFIFNENKMSSDEVIESNKKEILADCKQMFTIDDNSIVFDEKILKQVIEKTHKIIINATLMELSSKGLVDIGIDKENGEFVFSLTKNKNLKKRT